MQSAMLETIRVGVINRLCANPRLGFQIDGVGPLEAPGYGRRLLAVSALKPLTKPVPSPAPRPVPSPVPRPAATPVAAAMPSFSRQTVLEDYRFTIHLLCTSRHTPGAEVLLADTKDAIHGVTLSTSAVTVLSRRLAGSVLEHVQPERTPGAARNRRTLTDWDRFKEPEFTGHAPHHPAPRRFGAFFSQGCLTYDLTLLPAVTTEPPGVAASTFGYGVEAAP